jgi:glycosyltransferase involved in cell wall biosynthesis
MAQGCPVIACNCSAMPEVIGDAGILVEPGNSREFAQSILKFYENPLLREKYVQRGLNRIQNFSWQSSAQKMYKVICQAATQNQNN